MNRFTFLLSCLLANFYLFGQGGYGTQAEMMFCAQNLAAFQRPGLPNLYYPSSYQYESPGPDLAYVINNSPGVELCELQKLWIGQVPIPVPTNPRTLLIYNQTANGNNPPGLLPTQTTLSFPYNGWGIVGTGQNYHAELQLSPGIYYFCLYENTTINPFDIYFPYYIKIKVNTAYEVLVTPACQSQSTQVEVQGCAIPYSSVYSYSVGPPTFLYYNIAWSNGQTQNILPSAVYYPPLPVQGSVTVNYKIENLGSNQFLTTSIQKNFQFNSEIVATPSILGANTRCPNNNTYTIGNYQPSQAYNISVSHGTASAINANGQFTVTWAANFPNPGVATITVNTFTSIGCAATTTFEVASCCTGTAIDGYQPIVFTNASASQMLQSTNFSAVVNQIVLNGTIVIDQNLTITGCQNIKMAPNAEIVVNPGKTLTINGSRLAADECPYVWKGIVLPDPTANILVVGSYIEDARNAIWAKSNADVNVTNSWFANNVVGLRFSDLEPKEVAGPTPIPPHSSVIYNARFYTNGSFKLPFAPSYKGVTGVYADNIYELKIGQAGQPINQFFDIASGVYSINSYIKLVNNKIKNTTGSAVSFRNQIVNQNASYVYQVYSHLYAKGNTFEGTMPGAIYGFGWLEAEYNTFNNRSGNSATIWVRETNTASYVKNNTFNPLNNTTPVNMTVPAIKLERAAAPFKGMQLHVQNNVIQRYRSGIELTNTQANVTNVIPSLTNRKVQVTGNEVNNADNGLVSNKVYGIRLQHANGAKVADNTTKRLGNWTTSEARTQTERGIALSQTQNAQVVNNEIDSYGNGIWGAGNLKGTYFGCNILEQDFYGFYFLPPSSTGNTIISHQGNPNRTTQNRWIDPQQSVGGFDRVAGQVNATPKPEWYYNTTPNLYHAGILPINDVTGIVGQGINQVPQNNCNTFVWWTEGSYFKNYREDELGAIVQNEQQYQTLQEEFAQYGAEYLYDLLTMVPEVMDSLTPAEDEIYQNWMDSISATNIAAFYDVMEALDNGDITAAILQNAQIVPTNSIEANRKLVNYYYLTKYVQGIALGYEDEQALEPIALQTPYVGGDAVFGARVMLGIDPDEEGLAYKEEMDNGKYIVDKYRVYPNPANDVLNIEMTETPFTANTQVVLMDITGRVVLRYKNEASALGLTVPIHDVQNGVYLLQVLEGEAILLTERLVVTK